MENVIELSGICYKRGGKPILDDIDWKVKEDEHWAVVGANGSGKTTLMQIASGHLWPTNGTVTVLGKTFGITDLRDLRKKIGWVSANLQPRIPAHLLSEDVVWSGIDSTIGVYRNPSEAEIEKVNLTLVMLESENLAFKQYGILSTGEKQRVLIARALITQPTLLVLDEPGAGLDPQAREKLFTILDRMGKRSESPTIVLVTHHVEEVTDLFTHVMVLKEGKVVAKGPKEEVLTSEVMSAAFSAECNVTRTGSRYRMRIMD